MLNIFIAMGIGVLGSVVIQVSKGMQRQGIEIIRRNITIKKGIADGDEKPTKPIIYVIGIALANTNALWIILAARFAPTTYFTSMFGVGLIALVLYSRFVLCEMMTRRQIVGISLLILGTLMLGIDGTAREPADMSEMNRQLTYVWTIVFYVAMGIVLIISVRGEKKARLGLVFGIMSGGSASLDPIFKGIGQSLGGTSGFIPSEAGGWIPYVLSFIFGIAAFLIIQWGFAKGARASILGSAHSAVYVIHPVILQTLFLPGYTLSFLTVVGLITVILGIALTQGFSASRDPIPEMKGAQTGVPTATLAKFR